MSEQQMNEAQLLAAMAGAKSLGEQQGFAAQLEALRVAKTAKQRQHDQYDWADQYLAQADIQQDVPVEVPGDNALGTDWLMDVESTEPDTTDLENTVRAEASLWYAARPAEVVADREEFTEQARMASVTRDSHFGSHERRAAVLFLDHVSGLSGVTVTAEWAGKDPENEPVEEVDRAEWQPEVDTPNEEVGAPPFAGGTSTEDTETDPSDSPSLQEGDEPERTTPTTDESPVDATDDLDASDWTRDNPGDVIGDSRNASRKTAGITVRGTEWSVGLALSDATCLVCGSNIPRGNEAYVNLDSPETALHSFCGNDVDTGRLVEDGQGGWKFASRKTATSAQDHEIKAWLNEDEWTPEQITDLVQIIRGLGTEDEDAWVEAVQRYDSERTASRKTGVASYNDTNNVLYAVWVRTQHGAGITDDGLTRAEADHILSTLVLQPGHQAGIHEYLPGEWSNARLSSRKTAYDAPAPANIQEIVRQINETEFPAAGSPGYSRDGYGDEMLADYEYGYFGHPLGVERWPGSSYPFQLGYDDAEAGLPYGHSFLEEEDYLEFAASKRILRTAAAAKGKTRANGKTAARFSSYEELEAYVKGLMAQNPELVDAAESAYERRDQGWFNSQDTDTLKLLWEIAASTFFVGWDDEVYEALSDRPDNGFTASRKTAAPKDGQRSYCRLCGVEMEGHDYAWYSLKSSPVQRDVGQHYCVPGRNAPGEFNSQGDLVPGTPGGGGGQYDSPAGTIYDAGGRAIQISASRKTAISLTNVGIESDDVAFGRDSAGNKVRFRISPKDLRDLKSILYSDMAMNFSGVDIEPSDVIKEGSRRKTAFWDADAFWDEIDRQIEALRSAKSADDVIRILSPGESGDAFFGGSGGDASVSEALLDAGWSYNWSQAGYYWSMRAPDGSSITYIEGDIYKGNRKPLTGSRREEGSRRPFDRRRRQASSGWVHLNGEDVGALYDLWEKRLPGGDHLEVSVDRALGKASWSYVSREGYYTGGSGRADSLEQAKADAEASLSDANAGHGPQRSTARSKEASQECPECNGVGAVPALGGEDPKDVDNGQVQCPKCHGTGTVKTSARAGEREATCRRCGHKWVTRAEYRFKCSKCGDDEPMIGYVSAKTAVSRGKTASEAPVWTGMADLGNRTQDYVEVFIGESDGQWEWLVDTQGAFTWFDGTANSYAEAVSAVEDRIGASMGLTASRRRTTRRLAAMPGFVRVLVDTRTRPGHTIEAWWDGGNTIDVHLDGESVWAFDPRDVGDEVVVTTETSATIAAKVWLRRNPDFEYLMDAALRAPYNASRRKVAEQRSMKDLRAGDAYRDGNGRVYNVVSDPELRDDLGLGEESWSVAIADAGGNGYWDSWEQDEDPQVEYLGRAEDVIGLPSWVASRRKQASRSLSQIAREIRQTWSNVYFGAEPYLAAMESLDSINDSYFADSGRSIVQYFLSNAATWRGEDARRIKAELKGML